MDAQNQPQGKKKKTEKKPCTKGKKRTASGKLVKKLGSSPGEKKKPLRKEKKIQKKKKKKPKPSQERQSLGVIP